MADNEDTPNELDEDVDDKEDPDSDEREESSSEEEEPHKKKSKHHRHHGSSRSKRSATRRKDPQDLFNDIMDSFNPLSSRFVLMNFGGQWGPEKK